MKEAVLIYNPNAGALGSIDLENLMKVLKSSGIDAVYRVTEAESDIDDILKDPPGVVLAAGGDGTVRAVAQRIIHKDSQLGIIPAGTANNFARSVGLVGGPIETAGKMAEFTAQPVDIGRVIAPWGENIFIEGVGFGFFADLLAKYKPDTKKRVGRSIKVFIEGVTDVRTYKSQISIDGQSVIGEYLLIEILNSESVGPRLAFAKDYHINDGYLNVVRVTKSENIPSLAVSLFTDSLDSLPGVRRSKAKEVTFQWNGFPVHIDDQVYPDVNEKINYWYATNADALSNDKDKKNKKITVKLMDKKLQVLLPKSDR